MIRVILLLMGYCFGLIQTGYFYGKMHGVDIRSEGSGNSGATNSLRVLGKKAGAIVFLCDFLKCLVPCLVVRLIAQSQAPDYEYVWMFYTALGVILGHNFPFYLHFKGGKGISSSAGLILAFDIRIALVCLVAFILIELITRYVSVGSMLILTLNACMGIWFGLSGIIHVGDGQKPEFCVLLLLIMALGFFQHRANIVRLMNGTENKLGASKKQA